MLAYECSFRSIFDHDQSTELSWPANGPSLSSETMSSRLLLLPLLECLLITTGSSCSSFPWEFWVSAVRPWPCDPDIMLSSVIVSMSLEDLLFYNDQHSIHVYISISYGSSVQVPQNPSPRHFLLLNQQTGRESTMYRKLAIKKMYIIWKIRVTMYQKLVRKTRTMLNYLLSYHSISFVAFCWAINFHKYINYKFYLISIHIRINTCSRKRTLHMT